MRYLLLFILFSVGVQAKVITGVGKCIVGDYMTLKEAEERAYSEAKINALDKFGVYVSYESTYRTSEINDLNTSEFKSEIKSLSWTILKTFNKAVTKEMVNNIVIVTVTAVFNIDEVVFENAVDKYIEEETAKRLKASKIKTLQNSIHYLEKKIRVDETDLQKLRKKYYTLVSNGEIVKITSNKKKVGLGVSLLYVFSYDGIQGMDVGGNIGLVCFRAGILQYASLNASRYNLQAGVSIRLDTWGKVTPLIGASILEYENQTVPTSTKTNLAFNILTEVHLSKRINIISTFGLWYSGIGFGININ